MGQETLNRREFSLVFGLGIAQVVLGQVPSYTTSSVLDSTFLRFSTRYPMAANLVSYSQKKAKIETGIINLNTDYFCLVNFDLASDKDRFQIFNAEGTRQFSSLCSHGVNSGNASTFRFSNIEQSYTSSLGVYIVGAPFVGTFGPTFNLHGVSQQNSIAYRRRILLHGAHYSSREHIEKYGFLGRSLGCFALPKKEMASIYKQIKPGTLIFAKAEDSKNVEPLIAPTLEERTENRIP